jgi:hypothetical protein
MRPYRCCAKSSPDWRPPGGCSVHRCTFPSSRCKIEKSIIHSVLVGVCATFQDSRRFQRDSGRMAIGGRGGGRGTEAGAPMEIHRRSELGSEGSTEGKEKPLLHFSRAPSRRGGRILFRADEL